MFFLGLSHCDCVFESDLKTLSCLCNNANSLNILFHFMFQTTFENDLNESKKTDKSIKV